MPWGGVAVQEFVCTPTHGDIPGGGWAVTRGGRPADIITTMHILLLSAYGQPLMQ